MMDLRLMRMCAESAFRPEYRKGVDEIKPGGDHVTYGIAVSYFDGVDVRTGKARVRWWENKIEVHGDEALRDRVLAGLQKGE